MIDCEVVGCSKRQGEEYACTKRLFEERLRLWISAENRKYIVIKKTLDHTSVVCSKHSVVYPTLMFIASCASFSLTK